MKGGIQRWPDPVPRYLPEGALVEVTVRTLHSLFLLRPSASVNQIIRGVFARAQERFGVEVHAYCVMSNHLHLLLSPGNQRNPSAFMQFVLAEASLRAEPR